MYWSCTSALKTVSLWVSFCPLVQACPLDADAAQSKAKHEAALPYICVQRTQVELPRPTQGTLRKRCCIGHELRLAAECLSLIATLSHQRSGPVCS